MDENEIICWHYDSKENRPAKGNRPEEPKQNVSSGNSPAHAERTQSNHIFAAIYAYVIPRVIEMYAKSCFCVRGANYSN